jgi:hypothetical protein
VVFDLARFLTVMVISATVTFMVGAALLISLR